MLYTELRLPNGGRWDIWLTQRDYIGGLIKEFRVKPIEAEHLVEFGFTPSLKEIKEAEKAVVTRPILWDPGIRGGIRVPHLHYKGQAYLLDEKQWDAFSKKVIADAQAKLANVKVVSFDNLAQLAAAVEGMH
jgi:hypothetical protein